MDLVVDAVDVVGAVVVDVVEDVVDVNHAYLVDVGVVVIRPSVTQAWNAKQPDSIYGVGLFCMECLAGRF